MEGTKDDQQILPWCSRSGCAWNVRECAHAECPGSQPVTSWKEAEEHGKAAHVDVGTEHAKDAVQRVSEGKPQACSRVTGGGSINGAAVHV